MESYRGWNVAKVGNRTLLHSNQNFLWEQSEMKSKCLHGCDTGNCILEHNCTCGFYSLKTLKQVLEGYSYMNVYGVIYNHGSLIEGTNGFRSEYATVRVLYTSDLELGRELSKSYPDVAIMFPPPELLEVLNKPNPYATTWEINKKKQQEKQKKIQNAIALAKELYPEGPEAEKQRLLNLLRGASRQQIVEFAKEYGAGDWHQRFWLHKKENSSKAKPGDIIFEANDDTKPYVYIGSSRPSRSVSVRYMFGRNGLLYKRTNIRKWDEEPKLMRSRKQAIEEWE